MNDIVTVCTLNFGAWEKRYKECCRVLSPEGICQTITAGGGGCRTKSYCGGKA